MLKWTETQHGLGLEEMDSKHREFCALVDALGQAGDDDFISLFQQLVDHTRLHFAEEGRLMRLSKFPALGEHEGEHTRILGDLLQFNRNVRVGRLLPLARAYVREGLPEWFGLHLATMDRALAVHYTRSTACA